MTREKTRPEAEIESHRVKINGHNTHYLKAGSGPPVLLIHGGASDSRDWLGVMPALAANYSLYAPDLIGFGQTDRREEGYYLSDFSDFIREFADKLRLENPPLVGHSFGARVCLEVAFACSETVPRLVLIDAAGLGNVTRFGTALMTSFWALRKLFKRTQPYPKFLSRDGEDPAWLCEERLPDLHVPTLLIWKRYDPYLPLSIARRALEIVPGARLEVVPGYGHAPHQVDADRCARLLLDFLDGD